MLPSSDAKRAFVATTGHAIAVGGPGSGKTYAALLKAENIVCTGLLRAEQSVLFLSFARATLARVAQAAGSLLADDAQGQLEMSTYHGFAWRLLRSHGYLISRHTRLRLVPPHDARVRLSAVDASLRKSVQERWLADDGALHFDLLASAAADLLLGSAALARVVCARYPTVILDEFQDTNPDEWRLVEALGARSQIIALADPGQRIYEFRGADPRRIDQFQTCFSPSVFDFSGENHRSNGTDIVPFANALLSATESLEGYCDVRIVRYRFNGRGSRLRWLKCELLAARRRTRPPLASSWSLGILVPTGPVARAVSRYLADTLDNMPPVPHTLAQDGMAGALAALFMAEVLAASTPPSGATGLIRRLAAYLRGHADTVSAKDADLAQALDSYVATGRMRGSKRGALVEQVCTLASKRSAGHLSGDPAVDWDQAVADVGACPDAELKHIAEHCKQLHLMHRGSLTRSRLAEQWSRSGGYAGAPGIIETAIVNEHFAACTRALTGVHVMTIHQAKGKQFTEVLVFEDRHQGRYIHRDEADDTQARLRLRVAVSRAERRAAILTPDDDPCPILVAGQPQ